MVADIIPARCLTTTTTTKPPYVMVNLIVFSHINNIGNFIARHLFTIHHFISFEPSMGFKHLCFDTVYVLSTKMFQKIKNRVESCAYTADPGFAVYSNNTRNNTT